MPLEIGDHRFDSPYGAHAPSKIAAVVASIDAALVTVRTAIEELDDIDLTSQDVAIEIARGLEKDRWFLDAHIAAE